MTDNFTEEHKTQGRMQTIGKILQFAGKASIVVVVGDAKLYILETVRHGGMSSAMDTEATTQICHAQSLFQLLETVLERMDSTGKSFIVGDIDRITDMFTRAKSRTVSELLSEGK